MSSFFKAAASVLLCALIFAGCSSDRHLRNLVIAEGIGIDAENGGVCVTVQSLNVTASSSSETPEGNMTINTKSSSRSVSAALENMNKTLSKRLFFGQNKIIVIGKELAADGNCEYIDYLLRSDSARADILVALSENDAENILKSKENDASVPCENILNLVNNNEKTAQSIMVSADDLINMYKDETSDIYLPLLTRKDDEKSVEVGRAAVFSGDKLSKILDENETKGFVLLQGKAKSVGLDFTDERLGYVSADISNIKIKKYAAQKDGAFTLNAEISGDMILSEIENGVKNPLGQDDYERLTLLAEKALAELCDNAYAACRDANSDSLRLGEYVARDCPDMYEDYKSHKDKHLASSRLSCSVNIRLQKLTDNSRIE